MTDLRPLTGDPTSRAGRLDRAICDLLAHAPEIEAAAVVSFDGLPMVSLLPPTMDEDRVAAMSAALLSLGERAAEGLGRGELSQVYIEGESGTVFLVSCDNEAVLVAVGAAGAKVGLMLFEVRRAAAAVAAVLRAADEIPQPAAVPAQPVAHSVAYSVPQPAPQPAPAAHSAAGAHSLSHGYGAPAVETASYAAPQPAPAEPSYGSEPLPMPAAHLPEPVADSGMGTGMGTGTDTGYGSPTGTSGWSSYAPAAGTHAEPSPWS